MAHKIKKNFKPTRTKANALIIERKTNDVSYAEILSAVKKNDRFKDLNEIVKTMRPTQKGGLLIELKKGEEGGKSNWCTAIEEVLKDVANVYYRSHKITIQCKGLITELYTDDELLDAIETQAQVKRPDISAIKSKRKTFGGTESAYIQLPAEDAKKMLSLRHIKVGWVRSQLVEAIAPKRCFRCWAYDHVAAACKGPDRTALCRRCGEEGHQAAKCVNEKKCMLCEGAHAAGSGICPLYKAAMQKNRA